MPKKTKAGGGARRKIRQAAEVKQRELVFADAGQHYGVVTSVLGSRRFGIVDPDAQPRIGSARGSLRRKDRIGVNDLVLFSEREFERTNRNVDILFLYSADETRRLTEYEEIPPGFYRGGADAGHASDEDGVVFDDTVVWDDSDIDGI
jgi:initiation factor 1A